VQTSDKKLSNEKETDLYNQLVTLLSDIEHPKAMASLLAVFLTDTERSVLAKRLGIAWLLSQGKSYEEIQNELFVSSATISSMSDVINQPAMKQALEVIEQDKKVTNLLSQLFS
jgi:Trp operon repressor